MSIIVSAVIALAYTLFGGLVSVAYTDVVQIFFIIIGLFLALPFALDHPAVANIYAAVQDDGETPVWYGRVAGHEWGGWVDHALLCLLGGIPWQCYFQRVLSAQSSRRAVFLSFGGAAIALILTGSVTDLFNYLFYQYIYFLTNSLNWLCSVLPCSSERWLVQQTGPRRTTPVPPRQATRPSW